VSDENLDRVHDPLMSPLVWDLGHIAAFEDLWIGRELGDGALRPELGTVYDAAETPRAYRGELSYLRRAQSLGYMDEVRERTLSRLDEVSPFVQELVLQHEQQHSETMLQTMSLAEPGVYAPERRQRRVEPAPRARLSFEPQSLVLGDEGEGFAYDNERPRHEVWLDAFSIALRPVTNSEYAEFIRAGGYDDRRLWSEEGWSARLEEGLGAAALLDRRRPRAQLRAGVAARPRPAGDARVVPRGRGLRPRRARPRPRGRHGEGARPAV